MSTISRTEAELEAAERLDALAVRAMRDAMTLGRFARKLMSEGATGRLMGTIRKYPDCNHFAIDEVKQALAALEAGQSPEHQERRRKAERLKAAKEAERAKMHADEAAYEGEMWGRDGWRWKSALKHAEKVAGWLLCAIDAAKAGANDKNLCRALDRFEEEGDWNAIACAMYRWSHREEAPPAAKPKGNVVAFPKGGAA